MTSADEPTYDSPPPSPTFPPPPPVPRRLAALIVDLIMIGSLVAIGQWVLFQTVAGGVRPGWADRGLFAELYVIATASLPIWIYFAFLESGRRRGTVGKRLLRIRVDSIDGEPLTFSRMLLRTMIKLLPLELIHITLLLPAPLYVVKPEELVARPGFIFSTMLFGSWLITTMLTPKGQGVHDLVARTRVAAASDPSPDESLALETDDRGRPAP